MIFIDSNIPMYLIGAEHPLKHVAHQVVTRLVNQQMRLVTSAEVFQELLHRYQAIRRLEYVQRAFDVLHDIIDDLYPVTITDVESAKQLILAYPGASARNALHVAVMKNLGVRQILSFDADLDTFSGIERIWA